MANWRVSTVDKKSIEEHEFWEKDGIAIRRITGFRHGSWIAITSDDNEPDFERTSGPFGDSDFNAVDMYNAYGTNLDDVELEEMHDGWYSDVIWPDDLDEEAREALEEAWDEDSYEGWEDLGWVQTDTECWVFCDLKSEKIED